MAPKRSSTEAALQPMRSKHTESKRSRLFPSADMHNSNSSDASSASVSEASALQDSELGSDRTKSTSVSSESDDEDDEDSESDMSDSSGESDSAMHESDDEDDEVEEDRGVVALGFPKPKRPTTLGSKRLKEEARNLHERLQDFLPRLRAANGELLSKGSAANMEDVDDNEQHIEMNLGLGVLEEQRDSEQGSESGDSDMEAEDNDDMPDAMYVLLGKERPNVRPGIQEMQETNG